MDISKVGVAAYLLLFQVGGWSDKTILVLNSTIVEVGVELDNKVKHLQIDVDQT